MASISQITTMSKFKNLLKSNLIYDRDELCWYEKFNRFGALDPYTGLTTTKEYLFFSKPDCHIFKLGTTSLQTALSNDSFFIDLASRYPHVIQQLQLSAGGNENIRKNPFMAILSNAVKNTIDFQALTASEMDGPATQWGSSINYRKDAWTGDEHIEFSLEFEDSKWLEIYHMLLAYEKYERYVNAGLIYQPNIDGAPTTGAVGHNCNKYIRNKELHDVFGIYRIIVGEDFETIVYYAYICGAYFNSVPRDAFNDMKNGEGLRYTADFKAFCVDDEDPRILGWFNNKITSAYGTSGYVELPIYGDIGVTHPKYEKNDRINGEWAAFPLVVKVPRNSNNAWYGSQGMAYQYKLKWFTKK